MYSFVLRAHQKIDKVAYKHLSELTPCSDYLTLKGVIHFEGRRGPDSPKLKKGVNQQPWHFYDPDGKNDEFFRVVKEHYDGLVKELKAGDKDRTGFEAAWLAHALVDGLTPAHHYPYEEELQEIRSENKSTRETVRSHLLVKGSGYSDTIRKSMQLIGPKGLLTTHTTFEAGAATIILPLTLNRSQLPKEIINKANGYDGLADLFKLFVSEIDGIHMYERFYKKGWTPSLSLDVQRELAPRMVNIVTYAWYSALKESKKITVPK
jgi:hypothetical protein